MTMFKTYSIVTLAMGILVAAPPEISITGTVTDGSNPVKGAVISLVKVAGVADTTGTDGTFELSNATGASVPYNLQWEQNVVDVQCNHTLLSISLRRHAEKGSVTFYGGNGRMVSTILLSDLSAGKHNVSLPALSCGCYVLQVSIGNTVITRKVVVTGSGSYFNRSSSVRDKVNSVSLQRTMLAVDQLKVVKEGFVTTLVAIDSYKAANLAIVLEKGGDEPCSGGKLATTDVTKIGPFATVVENVTGAVMYRPKELLSGCAYPVVTWGHGAMGSPSDYDNLCTILASHGFVVISSSASNVQDGGTSANQFKNKMVEVAEWVIKQNDNSSSVLYQKIDTKKIGAAGHSQGGYGATEAGQNPLITTSVSSCGAVGSDKLKGPALILCGGKDNNSGAQCSDHPEGAYNGINNVPVMKANYHDADHGWSMDMMGSSSKDKPHAMLTAITAWFRYHLMGDEGYKSWFYGSDCRLCKDAGWTVKSKKMD